MAGPDTPLPDDEIPQTDMPEGIGDDTSEIEGVPI